MENYYLEKEKAKINIYDKIYSLEKILKNNSFNIFPKNDQYNELINRMEQLEDKMNSMDKKLETILGKMQK